MSRIRCLVDGCSFANRIIFATIDQVRRHLAQSHDYLDLQKSAFRLGIISEHEYRSHGWLVRKIADMSIMKE